MAETVESGFLAGYTGSGVGAGSDKGKPASACKAGEDVQDDVPCSFIPVDIIRPDPDSGEPEPAAGQEASGDS